MTDRAIKILTISLLFFVGSILIYFLVSTAIDGYWIWNSGQIDFAVTGQFGDFVGGFLGTIINGAAFYFLYLTLNEQRKSSIKQSFETKLFELLHLHRENISELRYTKFYRNILETSEARKVFRIIIKELIECIHEVKRFSKIYPELEVLKPEYAEKLRAIRKENNCKASIEDLAHIDIAFCIFYFGVSEESGPILLHKFFNRYNSDYAKKLLVFMKLKPKQEIKVAYKLWEWFKEKSVRETKAIFDEGYKWEQERRIVSSKCKKLFENLKKEKYYGGHQHRLGHYFRHLFQSFKFLSSQDFLSDKEKYFFAKTIRAQLSTYEQILLFFNSLSSLGMQWEYTADIKDLPKNYKKEDFKLITRYNLIKNLPGSQYYEFTYREYYRDARYEYQDDITYLK